MRIKQNEFKEKPPSPKFHAGEMVCVTEWFDDPKKESITEEVGDGTVVSKDKSGKVIGFEKLYVDLPKTSDIKSLPIEFSAA